MREAQLTLPQGRRWRATRAFMVGAAISLAIGFSGVGVDLTNMVTSPQKRAPLAGVTSPVWENVDPKWMSKFVDRQGFASLPKTYRLLAKTFPEDRIPEAFRLLADHGSPVLYRNRQTMAAILETPTSESQQFVPMSAALANAAPVSDTLPLPDDMESGRKILEREWNNSMDLRKSLTSASAKVPPGTNMAQARKSLELALAKSDLAAIRIPLPYWQSPGTLYSLAKAIEQADQELGYLSGWKGPILGMHGRVVLTVGAPGDSTTYIDPNGYIHIRSNWSSLAHEWFHALDYAAAYDLMAFPSRQSTFSSERTEMPRLGSLSADARQWRGAWDRLVPDLKDPALTESDRLILDFEARLRAMGSVAMDGATYPEGTDVGLGRVDKEIIAAPIGKSVPASGSPWLTWRLRAAQYQQQADRRPGLAGYFDRPSSRSSYLSSAQEMLAFSFGAQAQANEDTPLLGRSMVQQDTPAYRPLPTEARATSQSWRRFFMEMESWWVRDAVRQ